MWRLPSFDAGSRARLVEMAEAAYRGAHQEAIAFLDDALAIAGLDMRMADDDVMLLAGVHDARHPFQHGRMLVLPRQSELLAEVTFADQDRADARHLLEDVRQGLDAFDVLHHQ